MEGSPLPMLSAGHVRRSGIVDSPSKHLEFFVNGSYRDVTYDAGPNAIKFMDRHFERDIPVRAFLTWQGAGYGSRIAFRCNVCDNPCDYLIYHELQLKCISDYIASDHKYSKAHRRALIREAKDRLSAKRVRVLQPRPERGLVDRKLSDRTRDGDPRSTARAILLGRGANQHDWFLDYVQTPVGDWGLVELVKHYERPEFLDDLRYYASLDVRALGKSGAFKPGGVWGNLMGWPTELTDGKPILLIADNRESFSFLMLSSFFDGEPQWQRIELIRNSNGRRAMICPVTYQPFDLLHWRNGIFASREAQRLRHWSQSPDGRKLGRFRAEVRRAPIVQRWG